MNNLSLLPYCINDLGTELLNRNINFIKSSYYYLNYYYIIIVSNNLQIDLKIDIHNVISGGKL